MKLNRVSKAPTQAIECPSCTGSVRYYRFGGMAEMYPHFYCDACSNVYYNSAHRELVRTRPNDTALLEQVTADLPPCPCGGRFQLGSNPKCPNCRTELAHQHEPILRLSDALPVLVDGAELCRPED